MKHLVTCSNAGEAGFYQSMLAGAGIETEIRDSRSDITSIPATQLFVTEDHHAQAAALIAAQDATEPRKESRFSHPATGFPFLGIMGFTAIVWSISCVVLSAVSFDPETWQRLGTAKVLLQLLSIGAMSFLWGLFVGGLVALFCLIAKSHLAKIKWLSSAANTYCPSSIDYDDSSNGGEAGPLRSSTSKA